MQFKYLIDHIYYNTINEVNKKKDKNKAQCSYDEKYINSILIEI